MITKGKKQTEAKTPQIGVKLDPETFAQLEKVARDEHRTLANVARIAITELLERKAKQVAA